MSADPEAVTRALAKRADTLIAFFDLHTRSHHADEHGWWWIACGCGWGGTDGHLNPAQWIAHRRDALTSVLASLPDDRLAEAEAKGREDALHELADHFMQRDGAGYVVDEICSRFAENRAALSGGDA